MDFDVQGAQQAGYSAADIADNLATQTPGFDIDAARKAGYSDDELIQHLAPQPVDTPMEAFGHGAGVAGRTIAQGYTAIPTLLANLPAATANTVRWGADKALGIPEFSSPVPYVNPVGSALDAMGVAKPDTPFEEAVSTIGGALSGVKGATQLGSSLLNNGGTLEKLLAYKPALQYQAAVGGSASGEASKQAGWSPMAQTAASILGSFAAPTAIGAAKGVGGLIQPLTKSGQDQIVADTLATYADNPQQAAANLATAPQHIPGSPLTTGTASGDYGLIGLEKTMGQEKPFSDVIVQQNKARLDALNQVAGTQKDVDTAIAARSAATKPLYELSAKIPTNPNTVAPVLAKIDEQVAALGKDSDAGKTLLGMKAQIQGALPTTKNVATGLLDANGNPIMNQVSTAKPSSQLVQLYRENRDNLAKTAQQEGALGATVKGVIQPINDMLGQSIESANPLFKQAQDLFRQHSIPINQKQNMQDILTKIQGNAQDASGNWFLSPAKTSALIKNGEINTPRGWQPLQQALSPQQYDTLVSVQKDLARSELVNSPGIKPPGANTFNNLASSNVLSKATGGAINANVPLTGGTNGWLYRNANEEIKKNLIDTLKDPQRAAQLILQGTKKAQSPLFPTMGKSAAAMAVGGQGY